jgi:hypothetical protein
LKIFCAERLAVAALPRHASQIVPVAGTINFRRLISLTVRSKNKRGDSCYFRIIEAR